MKSKLLGLSCFTDSELSVNSEAYGHMTAQLPLQQKEQSSPPPRAQAESIAVPRACSSSSVRRDQNYQKGSSGPHVHSLRMCLPPA